MAHGVINKIAFPLAFLNHHFKELNLLFNEKKINKSNTLKNPSNQSI